MVSTLLSGLCAGATYSFYMSKTIILERTDANLAREVCTPLGDVSGVPDYVDPAPLITEATDTTELLRDTVPLQREIAVAEGMNRAVRSFHARKADLLNHAIAERQAETTQGGVTQKDRYRDLRGVMEWEAPTEQDLASS